jgi:hypothetical protein
VLTRGIWRDISQEEMDINSIKNLNEKNVYHFTEQKKEKNQEYHQLVLTKVKMFLIEELR